MWRERAIQYAFLLIVLVFAYTTILNIYERPEDIKIASLFIGAICSKRVESKEKLVVAAAADLIPALVAHFRKDRCLRSSTGACYQP